MTSLTMAAMPITSLNRGTIWAMFRGGRNPEGEQIQTVHPFTALDRDLLTHQRLQRLTTLTDRNLADAHHLIAP